jgi:hypothetical protein
MSQEYWDHIEPFWDSVNLHDGPEEFLLHFTEMPEHAAHLFALHWCATEVCGGGFHQLFFGSAGVLAPEAVAGFGAIGMPQTAAVVAAAIASFGEPYPRDRDERQDALRALDPEGACGAAPDSAFAELDRDFRVLLGREKGGMKSAAALYAARFPVPEGMLHGKELLNRLLGRLRTQQSW